MALWPYSQYCLWHWIYMTWSMNSLCKPLLPGWILHADSRIAHLPILGSTTPQSAGHPSQASERCRLPGNKEPTWMQINALFPPHPQCLSMKKVSWTKHCSLVRPLHTLCTFLSQHKLGTNRLPTGRRHRPHYLPDHELLRTGTSCPWHENICWTHGIQR